MKVFPEELSLSKSHRQNIFSGIPTLCVSEPFITELIMRYSFLLQATAGYTKKLEKYLPTRKSHSTWLYFTQLISPLQSTMWVQEQNLPLCLQMLKSLPLPRAAIHPVIPLCMSKKSLKKNSAGACQGRRIPVPVGCNCLLPYILLQQGSSEPSYSTCKMDPDFSYCAGHEN